MDDSKPSAEALKAVHKLIKKVTADIENFSYNTSVAAFMICVNELSACKCHSREVLEPPAVVLAPFAPHVAEELRHSALGHDTTVNDARWPEWSEEYLKENTANYAVSFNGKARFTIRYLLTFQRTKSRNWPLKMNPRPSGSKGRLSRRSS